MRSNYGNFTIKQLGLFSNDTRTRLVKVRHARRVLDIPPETDEEETLQQIALTAEERQAEEKILAYEVHSRLPLLLERNRVLTRRVRRAAARLLAPSRIVLNARPPDDTTTARRALEQVMDASPYRPASSAVFGGLLTPASSRSTTPSIQHFRLLDLPEELILLVVRHMSGDASCAVKCAVQPHSD